MRVILIVANIALALINVSIGGGWHGAAAVFCAVIAGMLLEQAMS